MNRFTRMKNTINHRKCFIALEKHLLSSVTRGYTHDLDKVFLYPILGTKLTSKLHRKYSRHHKRAKEHWDYVEMVIDWECARFTKPDKPLNAYNTLHAYYPELESRILPILKAFGIDKPNPACYPKRSQFDFKL